MGFMQNECPEPLEFLRNYNHFSTWPPKYPILLKYTKTYGISQFLLKFHKNVIQSAKNMILEDLG